MYLHTGKRLISAEYNATTVEPLVTRGNEKSVVPAAVASSVGGVVGVGAIASVAAVVLRKLGQYDFIPGFPS